MSRVERGFLLLYGGSWLGLIAVALLSLLEGADFDLRSKLVGGGRWTYFSLSLLSGACLAALPTRTLAWRLLGGLTAAGLLALAVLGMGPQGKGGAAMAGALAALALLILALLLALRPAAIRRHRPRRRPQRPAPPAPWRTRLPLALAWSAGLLALVFSFYSAWRDPDAAVRSSASLLLLLVALLALPALVLAHWRPRIAAGLLGLLALSAAGLPSPAASLLIGAGLLAFSSLLLWMQRPAETA